MASNTLEENSVRYTLFPKINCEKELVNTFLENYISDAYAKLANYLTRYIWHHTGFILKAVLDSKTGPHVQGVTIFDDNVDDEWFIVFLLVELTKFDHQLVVEVEDFDGQFLLIEAADSLPKWITPKTSEHRVFLHRGELHVIPLDICKSVNIVEAVDFVRQHHLKTRCDNCIQNDILRRINEFPAKIEILKHKARCYVPAAIVNLVREDPSLISHAIRSFYTRDVIDLKVCKTMKYFPPESRVMANIVMTRCMYSQLVCQKYTPDPKVGWDIPVSNSPNFKSYDLGMKIASGFEILVSGCNLQNESLGCEKKIYETQQWKTFVSNLEKSGYFRGLIKGSKEYDILLKRAEAYFVNTISDNTDSNIERNNSIEYVGKKIVKLLKKFDVDYTKLKREECNLEPEDNDDWMNIVPEELEIFLQQKFGSSNKSDLTELVTKVPKALKSFVNFKEAGIEGAEFPKSTPNDIENECTEVKLDVDMIGEALSNILHLKVHNSDTEDSSSDMSDYTECSDDSDDELRILDKNRWRKKLNESSQQNAKNSEIEMYMEAMDKELSTSSVGLSFEKKKPPLAVAENSDDSDYSPVDVDLNSLTNILESFNSQNGLPGPASNILSSMGIHLPPNIEETEGT
ncbi:protein SGT1-like isoform X1 [Leptotrombidium deliense]|uniref:Protein SGT1-like isoform X1 n=1 Tax=Leptotrombidium deliense TaxID=299467 RepID=A0A443SMJ6_9ACAR|nr:protein SGT1-like isoform X1 [Leptotrombidium deliense]